MKKLIVLFFVTGLISFISAAAISEDLHLNIQTTDSEGDVVTGNFAFVFNISTLANCSDVIYSNSTNLTTDSRGIISYYLENVNLSFSEQYWLCYYRDGDLINNSKIARTPYTFRARNITIGGIEVDDNLDMGSYNVSASWFKGIYDWVVGTASNLYLSFNGTSLSFNESALNTTIDLRIDVAEPDLDVNSSDYLDSYDSGYFMPLNTSVVGNFSFNGGWLSDGLSIIGGDIYAQTGWFYNITSLNVTKQNLTILEDFYALGKVGIGTTSPQGLLHVASSGPSDLIIQDTDVNAAGEHWYLRNINGNFYIGETTDAGGAWADQVARVTILDGGNVGIGTTGPNATLEVINGTTQGGFMVSSSSAGAGDLFIVDEAGNVGINTTSPDMKFSVAGNDIVAIFGQDITTGNAGIIIGAEYAVDKGGYILYDYNDNNMRMGVLADENVLVIDNNSRVGIGTASPDSALHVIGGLCIEDSDTGCAETAGDLTVKGGNIVWDTTDISTSDVGIIDDGVIALTTETSGNYVASVSGGTTITVTGSAGEGWTPSVAVTADSIDDAHVVDNGLDASSLAANSVDDSELVDEIYLPNGVRIGADAANNEFFTSSQGTGSVAMYIGNKRITTEDSTPGFAGITLSGAIDRTAAGTGYLDGGYSSIESTTTSGAIYSIGGTYVPGTTTLGNMYGIGYGYSGGGGIGFTGVPNNKWGMYVASGGTDSIFLSSADGIIYATSGIFSGAITAASFIYSSDRSLKDNITVIPGALDKIKRLEGVSFDWKKDGKASIGLIAQDVEKVFPEIVSTNNETGLKAVEYGNLVSPLIEAVKELDNKSLEKDVKIRELVEQNQELMERLDKLEKMISSGNVSDFDESLEVVEEGNTFFRFLGRVLG